MATSQHIAAIGAAQPHKPLTVYQRRRNDRAQKDFAEYQAQQNELDIQKKIEELLQVTGWLVIRMSQTRAVYGGLVGLPDVMAFRRGVTLFIECKRNAASKLRDSQKHFAQNIREHLSPTLRYVVAYSVEDVEKVI
jgi:hypothetical protein